MRYIYLGDKLTMLELRGMLCDPVRRPDGKCLVAGGKAAVRDVNGTLWIVLRRRLRLREKIVRHQIASGRALPAPQIDPAG